MAEDFLMQLRNPIFTASGAIDCEINHPTYGWIPFTASLDDVEEHGRAIFAAAQPIAAPYVPPEPPPPPPPPPIPSLTPAQWGFFLDLTGFRDALDAALSAMPKETMQERAAWAGLRNIAYGSDQYRLDVMLALVAKVRASGLPVEIPSDDDITAAFTAAAEFKGAVSLLGD